MPLHIQQTIDINVPFAYISEYLPSRCRNSREAVLSDITTISVPLVETTDAPIAYSWYDDKENKILRLQRLYDGSLWKPYIFTPTYIEKHISVDDLKQDLNCHTWQYDLFDFRDHEINRNLHPARVPSKNEWLQNNRHGAPLQYFNEFKDKILSKINAVRLICIDNKLWVPTLPPCYQILSFGEGNNVGGVGMFIVTNNQPNKKNCVFSADDYKTATSVANELAKSRHDTNSIPVIPAGGQILIHIDNADSFVLSRPAYLHENNQIKALDITPEIDSEHDDIFVKTIPDSALG